MSRKKHTSLETSSVEDFYLGLFDKFESEAEWIHNIYRNDDIDFLGINPDKNLSSPSTHKDWINSVYGIHSNKSKDSWKDDSHMGGMKLRSKYITMVAHLMQNLTQDGKISGELRLTKVSDIEELMNSGDLDVPEGTTEDQIAQLVSDVEKRLEKMNDKVLDNKQEAKTEKVYHELVQDYVKYGACSAEIAIRQEKKIRNYSTEFVSDESGERLVPIVKPGFKKSYCLKTVRLNPYRVFLDPRASGDAQAGMGVFKLDSLSRADISDLLQNELYNKKVIHEVLEEEKSDSLTASNSGSYGSGGGEVTSDTEPFEVITFWGKVTKKDLMEWKEEAFASKLTKELKAKHPKLWAEKFASFEIQAIFINSALVLLTPNLLSNEVRPIVYSRMVPVEDTNYGMGVFALGREAGRSMTKLWNRAVDNEVMVGTCMWSLDPAIIDSKTLVIKPGAVVKTKKGSSMIRGTGPNNGGLHQYKFDSVSQALLNLFDRLDVTLDELTLVPRNLSGVSAPDRMTATEVSQNLSSAQVILLNVRRNFDADIIQPDLESTYHYIQNDSNTSSDMLVDANVVVFGAETFALQLLNKQMVQEFLQMAPSLAQMSPDIMNGINWKEILLMTLEGIGFDKTKFINSEALSSQLELAQQQLQEMSQNLEAVQQEAQEVSQEAEKLEKEKVDLENKNFQLTTQSKVESNLLLSKVDVKNLQDQVKEVMKELGETRGEMSKLSSENNKLETLVEGLQLEKIQRHADDEAVKAVDKKKKETEKKVSSNDS